MTEYQVCTRCIMTNKSDPDIRFDENGHCNYCTDALKLMPRVYFPNAEGDKRLQDMLAYLKNSGKGKRYDCLMGISGGLDSAYLAYLGAHKWGLRIAAVHIDDGFDTEIAQRNIQRLVEACGIELAVIKPDEKQFLELSRAYLLAGVPNLAVPQDNILFAFLHKFARENDTPNFLSGGNFALECILQSGNTCDTYDVINLLDIHQRFGRDKLDKIELLSHKQRYADYSSGHVVEYRPLNFIDYNRDRAFEELSAFSGFEYYGGKHLENYFTAFLQLYWLPQKFGVDKRTSHLSSMILSGQMTREEALHIIKQPLVPQAWMDGVMDMMKEKLCFTDEAFDAILAAPTHQHSDYKVDKAMLLAKKMPFRKEISAFVKKGLRFWRSNA